MAEEYQPELYESGKGGALRYIVIAIVLVYVAGSLYLLYDMHQRLQQLEAGTAQSQQKMARRVSDLEAAVKASDEALTSRLGLTQEQLAKRTEELRRQQQMAESRLARQQKEQFGEVSEQVASVKGEVGGVKTDVGAVKSDLETTKLKLDRAVGDLGQQSGLIAHTREELDYLKHKGDRNYYEFTLLKGKRQPVSTVSLQLKKADPKRGKFTMYVIADDRTIEKKDRTMFEPMQFYTGRDRSLFEVVVMNVEKNKITGYLSAPKPYAASAATAQ
jgi:Skp family chaperone for outer membrane proteins